MSQPCEHQHLLEAYNDGQLDPATILTIEAHLSQCETCRERVLFQKAVRGSVRRDVRSEALPEDARARFMAALAGVADGEAIDAREERAMLRKEELSARSPAVSWTLRSAVPLTAAAALALVWGASAQGPLTARASLFGATAIDASREILDELVQEHSRPLPPERTDPKDLREFERYVGVPVKPRTFEKGSGARLVGGRVMPMHQERAAMLQYEVGSAEGPKRVSVLIYDPRRIQVGSTELAPRTVGTSEVRVGRARGYSVAVTEREGVGYALASDLDTERSAQFVSFGDDQP